MADRPRMTAAQLVDKLLASDHADVLHESIAWLVAELMDIEVARLTGAELGERGPERRTTQRNGYRPRTWDTRVGQLELAIPSCARVRTSLASWSRAGGPSRPWSRSCRRPTPSTASPPERLTGWSPSPPCSYLPPSPRRFRRDRRAPPQAEPPCRPAARSQRGVPAPAGTRDRPVPARGPRAAPVLTVRGLAAFQVVQRRPTAGRDAAQRR
jgi:hypothetical protein